MAGITPTNGANLLSSGDFSDLTIICQDREFRVHKAIVCTESDFFSALSKHDFQEQNEGRVHLQEERASIILRLLTYLYTKDYDDNLTAEEKGDNSQFDGQVLAGVKALSHPSSPIEVDAMVWLSADKFGIHPLKPYASHKFEERVKELFKSQSATDSLHPALSLILANTAHHNVELRMVATLLCVEHYESIKGDEILVGILRENEPIAWKLAESHLQKSITKAKRLETLYGGLKAAISSYTICRGCSRAFYLRAYEDNRQGSIDAGVRGQLDGYLQPVTDANHLKLGFRASYVAAYEVSFTAARLEDWYGGRRLGSGNKKAAATYHLGTLGSILTMQEARKVPFIL